MMHRKPTAKDATPATKAELSLCVLRHITSTSRTVAAAWDRALKPEKLTGLQFGLLATLANTGDLNVKCLARALGMDPSTVPRVIRPLARRRLLASRPGADARQRIIGITALGRAKFERALPCWHAVQSQVIEGFGEQRWEALITLLEDLRETLEGRQP